MKNINGFKIQNNVLVSYYGQDENVVIPDGVTRIENLAFDGCSARSIVIPSSVTSIGLQAFTVCSNLTEIHIPASVIEIGEIYTTQDRKEILNSGNPFAWCKNLTSITIESGNPVYHSAGNCIIHTKSKTLIGGCAGSVIPDDGSVTRLADEAFWSCEGMESIEIPSSVTKMGYWVFGQSDIKSVRIAFGITEISEMAFDSCSSLVTIELPESVTKIRRGAFQFCKKLASIELPSSIIEFEDDSERITAGAFTWCRSLKSIKIPSGITKIPATMFEDCASLKSIEIPAGVTEIASDAFSGCDALESITVEKGNPRYHSDGNCLIDTEKKVLVFGCPNSVIPSDGSVTEIADHAFYNCKLTSVTIPEGIVKIGRSAFSLWWGTTGSVDGLISVELPSSISEIGDRTFEGRNGLKSINLPFGIKEIPTHAFSDCAFESIKIPESVTKIGGSAFENCQKLESIKIPESVTEIGEKAFEKCLNLESIEIPSKMEEIGASTFCGCERLTEIKIPPNVKAIKANAFEGCNQLKVIEIPSKKTRIVRDVLKDCKSVTIRTVHGSLAEDYAWKNRINVEYIDDEKAD